jgi:hypothetical protein
MKSTWDQERRKKNGKRLKLVIANLPTGSPIEFDVREESIPNLLSK